MTRSLGTEAVHVELGNGAWTVRWPGVGVHAGPFSARVHANGGARRSGDAAGAWTLEVGDGYGRPGAWAHWTPRGDAPALALHVPSDGGTVVASAAYRATAELPIERLIPLTGTIDLAAPANGVARLVNGYDSWAYAGVRSAEALGLSWWNAAYAATGRALAIQALEATRFATAIASRPEADRVLVDVACGATPPVQPAPGSWGYETLPPPGLALPARPGDEERSPAIALLASRDAFAAVEELAELAGSVSGARRWRGAPISGWESWYHYGLVVSAEHVIANARTLRERYADRPGFDLVQVDDGWQVTYGAWWPNDRFPEDLTELTAQLRALGARPGLWLAPFMVQPGAPGVASDHPEWAIADEDGAPALDRHGRWGIDATHPDARAWLHDLGARVRGWGFEMVKLDFLSLGAIEGERHDRRATGTAALRDGLRAFLDGLGDDVYVLACGAPMLPLAGLCHGNRIGHDLAVPVLLRDFGQPLDNWTAFSGIRPQGRNVAARWALHRRWFDADPDVVMAWGSDGAAGGYGIEESRALATVAALCGGPFLLADELTALRDEERAVLEHAGLLDLACGDGFRPIDLFERIDAPELEHFFDQPHDLASVWIANRGGRRVAALFNWTAELATCRVPDGFAGARELWTGATVHDVSLDVPPHAVRVLVA